MDHYDEIAAKDGLVIPASYRQMCDAGLFSYFGEADYADLEADARVALMRERALSGKLLYFNAIEWYTPLQCAGMVKGLVPFAGDGAGDQYCWYVPWAADGRVPIVYFDHEMWTVTGHAPDFETWLYKVVLDQFVLFDTGLFKPEDLPALAAAYVSTVTAHVSPERAADLLALSARPVVESEDGYSVLSLNEWNRRFEKGMRFTHFQESKKVEPKG